MTLRGVLFDLDGTLINTNELIFQSYDYALDKVLHTSLPRTALTDTFGKPLQQIMQELGGAQAEPLREAFVAYTLAHEDQITLFPHVKETLMQLKASGIGIALVTSRLYRGAIRDLNLFDLVPYFDAFITPEATQKHKPHPEPAQKAAAALHLDPEQVIFVGDSSHDLQCGRNAGCRTAVVSYSVFPQNELLKCQPHYIIDDLLELVEIVQKS
ncbi:MAG: HAD-IA family hydrolase [Peptococcaceae bacterium]